MSTRTKRERERDSESAFAHKERQRQRESVYLGVSNVLWTGMLLVRNWYTNVDHHSPLSSLCLAFFPVLPMALYTSLHLSTPLYTSLPHTSLGP